MANYAIIDAYNLFNRCKFANNSSDIDLNIANSISTILNSMKNLYERFDIDHMVFCLDGHGSWRYNVYSNYKGTRKTKELLKTEKEKKDDCLFFDGMKYFSDYLSEKTDVTVLNGSECEADDFIARWIQLHPTDQHVILSSDQDFYQLISENVKIFDAMKGWIFSQDSVTDINGKPAKVKVKKNEKFIAKDGTKSTKTKYIVEEVLPPNAEYELFKKIIRGDTSDSILPSYPGVREKGSSKRTGIIEAFEDRNEQGYNWNSFMNSEWTNEKNEIVVVKDAYNFNKKLIDLTLQPDEIKAELDSSIVKKLSEPRKTAIGFNFAKMCKHFDLPKISQTADRFTIFLNKPYGGS